MVSFYDAEILALFNQVKSRPCICHHVQKHISLSALWSAGRNAPRVRFHTENTGRRLQSDLQAAEVISISVEEDDYKDFDFDEFMISAGCRCKWDSAFQNQLDSKAIDSTKIKTNIMKFEIKWWCNIQYENNMKVQKELCIAEMQRGNRKR